MNNMGKKFINNRQLNSIMEINSIKAFSLLSHVSALGASWRVCRLTMRVSLRVLRYDSSSGCISR